MIPTERVVVVVVVVIASRPFASRPSRSRRSLDRRRRSTRSQTSSTRRAVASTIDDRIELNRPRRGRAVGRSVGRSIDVRVVEKYIDASSIDFRIDRRVVDRFESTSSIDARGTIARGTMARRARIRDDDDAPRGADSPTRTTMAKKNVKAGMKARKDALVDMQTVSARQTTVRENERGPLRKTPSRGRRRRRIANE